LCSWNFEMCIDLLYPTSCFKVQATGVRPAILAILLMPSNDSGSKRSRNSELQESQA
jgi:hypothetical protein